MFVKPLRFVQALILGCFVSVGMAGTAGASPADLDRSFGQEGISRLQSDQSAYVVPEDMAVGPNGEIYVLRSAFRCSVSPCLREHLVSRSSRDGILDRSFGVSGVRSVFMAARGFTGSGSLAVMADGRVIVGSTDDGKLVLGRLNPNGTPDGTFGNGGAIKLDLGIPVDRVRVAAQTDGRIVIAAEPRSGYGGDAVIVARFTSQGAPDPGFNGGIPVVTSLGSGVGDFALSGERTVLAGPRCCGFGGGAVHLMRLDQNGVFDSNFGNQGQSFIDDVTEGVGIGAVIALPDGRIYVAGSSKSDKGDVFALRLLPTGRLDHRFGNRGIAYMRRSFLTVDGVAVDHAGRLLIAGIAPAGTRLGPSRGVRELAILRRLSNGRRDRTFAGGSLMHLGSPSANQMAAVGLQEGSKLVALVSNGECSRGCPSPITFLVRFIGGTSGSSCKGKRATIVGTRQGEELVGTPRRDVIAALAGNDSVNGRGGKDVICGGRGDDKLRGGPGRDVLSGGPGRNRLQQ